ncbi:MAG: hypothetical protein R2734_11955 [Nocardioides sp.]
MVHHAGASTQPPRDELAIKLALAVTVPGVDVGAVIQQQRAPPWPPSRTTPAWRQAGDGAEPGQLAWTLVLDSLVFNAEAEIRWLDHCEASLRRAASERPRVAAERPQAALRPDPTEGVR